MSLPLALAPALDERVARGLGGCFYGAYVALVVDLDDPDGQGRVRVRLPWSPDTGESGYEAWARMATMMAGNDRGSWFIPDVEDEVLVMFEAGDTRRPYVIGALWNGQDAPPEQMDSASENNVKKLRTRSGITITFDDSSGSELLKLETPGGRTIELDDSGPSIEVDDGAGNVIKLESSGISITASAKVKVEASTVEISAGMVKVDAGMSKFSGVVQADTVITNSVVSSSYTPGAGNIW